MNKSIRVCDHCKRQQQLKPFVKDDSFTWVHLLTEYKEYDFCNCDCLINHISYILDDSKECREIFLSKNTKTNIKCQKSGGR